MTTEKKEFERPRTGPKDDEDDPNSQGKKFERKRAYRIVIMRTCTHSKIKKLVYSSKGSRRLEIDRPPTRSGSRAETKKASDSLFDDDDDDVLGGMGLDDSPKTAKKTVKKTDDDDRGKV